MLTHNHSSMRKQSLVLNTPSCAPVSSLSDSTPRTPRSALVSPNRVVKKHSKNITKRRPRTSHIWNYSTTNPEEGITLNGDGQEVWVCSICKDKKTTYLLSGGTAAPIRHLSRVHNIEPTPNSSRPRRHSKQPSQSSINLIETTRATSISSSSSKKLSFDTNSISTSPIRKRSSVSHKHSKSVSDASARPKNFLDFDIDSMDSVPTTPSELLTSVGVEFSDPFSTTSALTDTPATPVLLPPARLSLPNSYNTYTALRTSETDDLPFQLHNLVPHTSLLSEETTDEFNLGITMDPKDPLSIPDESVFTSPLSSVSSSSSASPENMKLTLNSPVSFDISATNSTVPAAENNNQHVHVNVESANRALLKMVIDYDVPPSVFQSEIFKSFCDSLNPEASTALPTINGGIDTSRNSSDAWSSLGNAYDTLDSTLKYTLEDPSAGISNYNMQNWYMYNDLSSVNNFFQ
ncbi:hypothetical protein DV113_003342 [Geotrichum candidum]|uniref:BED-type domain-containing protein n=1 Tax=Geotrichum candidum TaxID=1173061 RepID=A0A0J9XFN7_GEOCN|nr:hypothetical protein DV113_003342 [Geotrichum candidum]CDO56137.1 hypothetical protein, no similarity [Geotrichum candidum]